MVIDHRLNEGVVYHSLRNPQKKIISLTTEKGPNMPSPEKDTIDISQVPVKSPTQSDTANHKKLSHSDIGSHFFDLFLTSPLRTDPDRDLISFTYADMPFAIMYKHTSDNLSYLYFVINGIWDTVTICKQNDVCSMDIGIPFHRRYLPFINVFLEHLNSPYRVDETNPPDMIDDLLSKIKKQPHKPTRDDLQELVDKAIALFKALSPEEQAAHLAVQRANWVSAEMELGRLERETTVIGGTKA